MSESEYLSVMSSIVLGLGLTQVLTALGKLIQARSRVRPYWPLVAWLLILAVVHVQVWWAMFGLQDHLGWTFGAFAIVLLQIILLSILATVLSPHVPETGEVDLRQAYFAQSRWVFGLLGLVLLVSLVKDVIVNGGLPEHANLATHVVLFLMSLAGAFSRSDRVHKAMAPIVGLLLTAYIALLFGRLP